MVGANISNTPINPNSPLFSTLTYQIFGVGNEISHNIRKATKAWREARQAVGAQIKAGLTHCVLFPARKVRLLGKNRYRRPLRRGRASRGEGERPQGAVTKKAKKARLALIFRRGNKRACQKAHPKKAEDIKAELLCGHSLLRPVRSTPIGSHRHYRTLWRLSRSIRGAYRALSCGSALRGRTEQYRLCLWPRKRFW